MQRGCLDNKSFKNQKMDDDGRSAVILLIYSVGARVMHAWMRVPTQKVASVQSAIEGYKRCEKLANERVEITDRMTQLITHTFASPNLNQAYQHCKNLNPHPQDRPRLHFCIR